MTTIDDPQPDDERPQLPPTDGPDGTPPRFGRTAKVAAPVIAAVLVGGGVVLALDRNSGSTASAGDGPTAALGRLGGVAGEQHVQGTVTATTGSTVTVKTSGGSTATYTVNSTSEIVRNGQSATLADVKVGDPVLVHVYPSSSGQLLVERLLAGTSASAPGPGALVPRGYGPQGGGPGGIAGEQHVQGTVTATTGSTVTVKTSGGSTATYTVNSTSEIVRNGQSATLADVKVGDPVLVHVYPSSSGQLLVERLFAGSSASGPGGGGFGPPPDGAPGGSGTQQGSGSIT
jgi:hypothetical protein